MRFDWYQASIPGAHPQVVMDTIAAMDYYGQWEQTRAGKNYDSGAAFVVGNESRFRINFGGQNSEHGPNIVGSGADAQVLAELIRDKFPVHRVSRADSCEDFHHKDAYDYLRRIALKIAKEQRVQCREIVKPLTQSDDGRTLYLGSQTSAVSMRIYEKGKQLGVSADWVRAELQLRPQKDVKSLVAALDPTQVWGLSKWSHAMGVELGNKSLQRVQAQVYQPSDHERAYRFMLKQYRKVFEQMLASHGSPEAVGSQIFYDLEHSQEAPVKASLKAV